MNLVKPSSGDGRDASVEDPVQIRLALTELEHSETEFPIKVEGTHTLPYTAWVKHLDPEKGLLFLKLIRPLPHEMVSGAPFQMLFALEEQRFEAPLTFLGRESYLLYRFTIPIRMVPSDRRAHKRYPFRPREKAYVLAQDGSVPGFGLAGPLVNLSLGGLAFRVDRVIRLDDHLRVTPGPGFFEKGKELPILKIRDLPKLPLFESRGMVANAWEQDGETHLGVQFRDLNDVELRQIRDVLTIREQMQKHSSSGSGVASVARGARSSREPAVADSKAPGQRVNPAGTQSPDALLRLARRSTLVVVALAPGLPRAELGAALAAAGYLRLEMVDTLEQATVRLRAQSAVVHRLLLVSPPAAEPIPHALLRGLQREPGTHRELPMALLQLDGLPESSGDPKLALLPWPEPDPATWAARLDDLAGL